PGLGVLYGVLTGIAYAGFLLCLRQGAADLRRVAGPLADATLVAAIGSVLLGIAYGDFTFTPALRAQGWLVLLALSSQVLGWLLISVSLPRLPAALTSVLLTLQPVLSVLFAAAILGESPSSLQLLGVVFVLGGLLVASVGRREPIPEPALAESLRAMASRGAPFVLLATTTLLWGTTYRATAIGTSHSSALMFGALRSAPAGLALVVVTILARPQRPSRRGAVLGAASGLLMVAFWMFAISEGVARAGAAN